MMDQNVKDDTGATNAAAAYDEIKRRLIGNHYPLGMTVSVQELCSELSMSRTPVNQALIRLEREHLVEFVPRRGFRVSVISPEEMLDIYRIAIGLEAVTIDMLIERGIEPQEERELLQTVVDLEEALRLDDRAAWSKCDARFHGLLLEFCRSKRLQSALQQLIDQLNRVRGLTLLARPKPVRSTKAHRALAEAIVGGNAEKAHKIHREQRLRSARELAGVLSELNLRHL